MINMVKDVYMVSIGYNGDAECMFSKKNNLKMIWW